MIEYEQCPDCHFILCKCTPTSQPKKSLTSGKYFGPEGPKDEHVIMFGGQLPVVEKGNPVTEEEMWGENG